MMVLNYLIKIRFDNWQDPNSWKTSNFLFLNFFRSETFKGKILRKKNIYKSKARSRDPSLCR